MVRLSKMSSILTLTHYQPFGMRWMIMRYQNLKKHVGMRSLIDLFILEVIRWESLENPEGSESRKNGNERQRTLRGSLKRVGV